MYRPEIKLDLQRSRLITEAYKETESEPMVLRRAKAFEHVLANMDLYIQDWEKIVGNVTSTPEGLYYGIDQKHRAKFWITLYFSTDNRQLQKGVDMPLDRNFLAHCGLYCGTCAVLMAHRDGNRKFKELLAPIYFVTADDLVCEGCRSAVRPVFCETCAYKDCANEKEIDGCHQCDEWPCKPIEDFPIEVGKKVIMRAIPAWRDLGDEQFAEEEKRYLCLNCGLMLFRGAKRCRQCKEQVDMD